MPRKVAAFVTAPNPVTTAQPRMAAATEWLNALAAGVTIYAPAIILSTMLGWRLDVIIVGTGLLVIVYTVTGGDWDTLLESVRGLVDRLPPDTVVHPGHGPATTLGRELQTNPFLRDLRAAQP